jgi:uncharacterized protein with PIN domain
VSAPPVCYVPGILPRRAGARSRRAIWFWGEGRHPAALNIVDCCSCALAAQSGEPPLAVGDDFAQTDLELVDLQL